MIKLQDFSGAAVGILLCRDESLQSPIGQYELFAAGAKQYTLTKFLGRNLDKIFMINGGLLVPVFSYSLVQDTVKLGAVAAYDVLCLPTNSLSTTLVGKRKGEPFKLYLKENPLFEYVDITIAGQALSGASSCLEFSNSNKGPWASSVFFGSLQASVWVRVNPTAYGVVHGESIQITAKTFLRG